MVSKAIKYLPYSIQCLSSDAHFTHRKGINKLGRIQYLQKHPNVCDNNIGPRYPPEIAPIRHTMKIHLCPRHPMIPNFRLISNVKLFHAISRLPSYSMRETMSLAFLYADIHEQFSLTPPSLVVLNVFSSRARATSPATRIHSARENKGRNMWRQRCCDYSIFYIIFTWHVRLRNSLTYCTNTAHKKLRWPCSKHVRRVIASQLYELGIGLVASMST